MSHKQPILAEHIVNIRTIGENAAWTIFGRVGPMLVAVALTPGTHAAVWAGSVGIFSIALTLIGIFGIFDFGIGRVITRNIAERIALGTVGQLAAQIKTSLAALLALGLSGRSSWRALVEYWIRSTLKIPAELYLGSPPVFVSFMPGRSVGVTWKRDVGNLVRPPAIQSCGHDQHTRSGDVLCRTASGLQLVSIVGGGDRPDCRAEAGGNHLVLAPVQRLIPSSSRRAWTSAPSSRFFGSVGG